MKKAVFVITTVGVALLVVLVAAEVLLRLFHFPAERESLECAPFHREMESALRASFSGAYTPRSSYTVCTDDYRVRYEVDTLGYLGVGQRDPQPRSLLVFGDSFAFGMGVPAARSFARRLDGYNAGLWGASFGTHASAFAHAVPTVKPAEAIWVIYPPHLVTISDRGWASRRTIDPKAHPLLSGLVRWFNTTKLSAILITTTGVGWNRSNYETLEYSLYDAKDRTMDSGYTAFEEAVVRIVSIAHRNSVRLIPVFVPSKIEWTLTEGHQPRLVHLGRLDPDLPVDRMSRILEEHGVPIADQIRLRPLIRSSVDRWQNLYFKHDAHWNASGHEKVAFLVGHELERIRGNSGVLSVAGKTGVVSLTTADLTGGWTTPPYSDSDFSASGSMTWRVDPHDLSTYRYVLIGNTMVLAFDLNSTSVAGSPDLCLRIAVPGGFTIKRTMTNLLVYKEGASPESWGRVMAVAGQRALWLFKPDNARWAPSPNATRVSGEITFEINGSEQ